MWISNLMFSVLWCIWSYIYNIYVIYAYVQFFIYVQLLVIPWTVAHQAPLCLEVPRQEYWSGVAIPLPRYPLDPEIELTTPASPALETDSLPLSHQGSPHYVIVDRYRIWIIHILLDVEKDWRRLKKLKLTVK